MGDPHTSSVSAKWVRGGPPAPVLSVSFVCAGLGTVLLGPLLPQLLREWNLSDQRGGWLLAAKFIGSFVGGVLVPRRLRLGIVAGHILAALGFSLFSFAHSLSSALPLLFLAGIGLGEMIASTNVFTGRRWPAHAGSALALLNFFWSLGAVSTGFLAAALLPVYGWRKPVLDFAALLAITGLGSAFFSDTGYGPAPENEPQTRSAPPRSIASPVLAGFAALLSLYGGLEACLTAWITTFSQRFAGAGVLGGQSGFVVLWAALTVGRLLASALLRRFGERRVQRASLGFVLLLVLALLRVHSARGLAVVCVSLGLALAPVFPASFGMLLRQDIQARQAGFLLALSGLGAALFPATMGIVSTATSSLRLAMLIPALLVPAMLLVTPRQQHKDNATSV